MQKKSPPYTLGLDIGIASVGAALLILKEKRILALHVRTFDKAETADKGESLNKIRRESRLTRRRIGRRAFRLKRLARLMKRKGIIERASPDTFVTPHLSPWDLRAAGLNRMLEKKEWAAIIYHMVKHRGFQSNRKSEAKADAKIGDMLAGVRQNSTLLKKGEYRSIGELAVQDPAFSGSKRNKGGEYNHTFAREDLTAELDLLFERQGALKNPFAGETFHAEVKKLLLQRRPPLSGDALLKMVGTCTFEKDELRAPKAGYTSERFIWLGKLNNLKIVGDGNPRPLTDEERKAVIELPFETSKLTFNQIRAKLNLTQNQRFNLLSYRNGKKGDDKDPEKKTFFEATFFHKLCKAYSDAGLDSQWERDKANPGGKLDTLGYALTVFKEDSKSREYLRANGVDDAIIEAALTESFEKFIHLSQKALNKILPFMEDGQRYDEAANSAGYNHNQPIPTAERKPSLSAPDRNSIRNPVVYRALNQARKMVNAIIKQYGPPAQVNIELARDLSKSFDERNRIAKEQENFRTEKEGAARDFQRLFQRAPKGPDIMKWRFFKEQIDQCPYCQKALDVNRLFNDNYSQIDHILPSSRSFDDSLNNKVVVHIKCNQDKRNLTPYEFLDGATDGERWRKYSGWVQSNKSIRQAKKNRLLRVNFGAEEAEKFRERNLNDTRYICREFKNMVESNLKWHENSEGNERCLVLSGQLTALLRARWGLLKNREGGDLHHALDAAVIAATNSSLVKRMSDYSRRKELEMVRENCPDPETGETLDVATLRQIVSDFPKPYPHFREELLGRLSATPAEKLRDIQGYDVDLISEVRPIHVSRAPTRRGLGSAHQDTIRSIGGKKKKVTENRWLKKDESAVKTPIDKLRLADLEKIVGADDPRNKKWIDALRERLEPHKAEDGKSNKCAGAKAFAKGQPPLFKPSGDGKTQPQIRNVKLKTTQKSGIQIRGGIANNGDMLRADIFTKEGKFYAVPLYVADAVKKELSDRAVSPKKPENQWPVMDKSYQFLFSLYRNDWVVIRLKNEVREGYYAGLNRSNNSIDLWSHDHKTMLEGNGIRTALGLEKFHVDILGNLYRAKPETRKKIHVVRQTKR
jgi:CRISPR-associated endonuclease Csn1